VSPMIARDNPNLMSFTPNELSRELSWLDACAKVGFGVELMPY
jgi:hypothetical protein